MQLRLVRKYGKINHNYLYVRSAQHFKPLPIFPDFDPNYLPQILIWQQANEQYLDGNVKLSKLPVEI